MKNYFLKEPLFAFLTLVGLVLVVSAFVLEHGFGAAPCHLCWLQRYGHWALLVVAATGLFWRRPQVQAICFWLAAAAIMYGFFLGGYHVLVQEKIITGPQGCTGALALPTSTADFLNALKGATAPRCDEVNFRILGLSLAVWNVVAMAFLLGVVYNFHKSNTKR